MKYTNEKNILMLIALLKKFNIKKIVVSPGAMNVTFVGSIQNDPFFEIYSCVDERSACYMACGLAEESGEIVALSCTGATSSRNYMPGLTEAFYRKLPILAITSTLHYGNVGQNLPQVLDRTNPLNDIVKYSAQIQSINTDMDEWAVNLALNKALLELTHNSNGPVHINLTTTYSDNYSVSELPEVRKISRYTMESFEFPEIKSNKVCIFVGAHSKMDDDLTSLIDLFCEKYNAYVICDRTSNYFGKYRVMANILFDQENFESEWKNIDLLISIGNISGAYMTMKIKEVWRVNPDGEFRDNFRKLTNVFEMSEKQFFKKYNLLVNDICNTSNYEKVKSEYDRINNKINLDLIPFSNIWTASQLIEKLPDKSVLHLAILNSLRSWNYFDSNKQIYGYCNTGGFGIDGILSTIIGASFVNKEKNIYGVIGDLAFFYDMNSLGNRLIGNNLRIILINNGCGTEFHNYSHSAQVFGENVKDYIAADGHFGNKSNLLVKNYVESLGFEYISASNKEEFAQYVDYFTSDKNYDRSIIFEVFTNSSDESKALKQIRNIETTVDGKIKNVIKNSISTDTKNKIKKFLGK